LNAEQAYINGFLNRAMEYGYSEDAATQLCKEAMRGANAYRMVENFSKPIASDLVRSGLPHIPGRGTADASRLAELVRKLKAGRKSFPKDPRDVHRFLNNRSEASRILHPFR
jgi:hypothetical protein